MNIDDLRRSLLSARELMACGETEQALLMVDRALDFLSDRLLTTTGAAEFLGVGSVNTVKALVRRAGLHVERHGNRMMIPLSELERLQQSPLLAGIRESNRMHDKSSDLGSDSGLSEEDMGVLEDERESVPWSKNHSTVPT